MGLDRREFLAKTGYGGLAAALVGYVSHAHAQVPIDSATIWTPERFIREIAEAPRVTYVHWTWEGLPGVNRNVEKRFVGDVQKDFLELSRIIRIDLSKYSKQEMIELVKIPERYSTTGKGMITRVPAGSLFKSGIEFRIFPMPAEEKYLEEYAHIKTDMKSWLQRV